MKSQLWRIVTFSMAFYDFYTNNVGQQAKLADLAPPEGSASKACNLAALVAFGDLGLLRGVLREGFHRNHRTPELHKILYWTPSTDRLLWSSMDSDTNNVGKRIS